MSAERNALLSLLVAILAGAGIAAAGSAGGAAFRGAPVFALCVALAYVVQWLVFVPAYVLRTERFFDLTGALTYILVVSVALMLTPPLDVRSGLLWALVVAWAARLGTFLFARVQRAGKDSRFDDLKSTFVRFLNVWTIQGLWVSLTLAAALAAITSGTSATGLDAFAFTGLAVWVAGFAVETIADAQKRRFRADPANSGRFISTGLWAWSRHPNYFGEIVLWTGIAIIAVPALSGWQWVTLISPVFVFVLLTRISGIPLLEKRADATWGGQDEYERYKAQTPVLVPLPHRRSQHTEEPVPEDRLR
jgi:steroid 5-alpha reductase family enzyme